MLCIHEFSKEITWPAELWQSKINNYGSVNTQYSKYAI